MPEPANSLLDEGNRVLRELAVQQGEAYCAFGEALQRFGERQIGWAELVKNSGDLYVRGTVHTAWSLIRANTNVYTWMLSLAGARPLRSEPEPGHERAPSAARTRRGRG